MKNLQEVMAVMQLMQMLRQPRMQQQELDMQQQVMQQRMQQEQARQEQMKQQGILQSLTNLSMDPVTGGVEPSMVLDYLKQIGTNIQRPQVTAGPSAFFQQQSK